ncbi:MAG: YiiX family permuted papain-like enzyme [Bacteroidota bacterium]
MKKSFLIIAFASLFILSFIPNNAYKDGDLIFQATSGATGQAIQLATHSKYNHCGILFFENNEWIVYEAVQPVKKTSLKEFEARGKGTVKRLSNKELTKEDILKLKTLFKTYEHKNYDEAFNWSDDRIYCSELVYKLYNNALQIELCKPRKLGDFDLSNPLVKEKLNEKYKIKIPLNEPMVSPEDIFRSGLLTVVN